MSDSSFKWYGDGKISSDDNVVTGLSDEMDSNTNSIPK